MVGTVFITGAGAGIGRAAAERFAAEGWIVGAADVNAAALDALRTAIGPRHHFRTLDVTDAGAVSDALAEFAALNGGKLHLLLNNAGIGVLDNFEDTPLSTHHATIEVNVKGVINCSHAAFPYLKAAGRAKVINMGSLASEYGIPSEAVYSASKFFVRGLTEAINIEWERFGIHVSDIMPNFVRTPMMAEVSGKLVDSLGVHLSADDVVSVIWRAAADRSKVHWVVDRPKTTCLRSIARVLPPAVRRSIYKRITGY